MGDPRGFNKKVLKPGVYHSSTSSPALCVFNHTLCAPVNKVPMRLSSGGGAPSDTDDGAVWKRVTVTCTLAKAIGIVGRNTGPTSMKRPGVGIPPFVSVLPVAEQMPP